MARVVPLAMNDETLRRRISAIASASLHSAAPKVILLSHAKQQMRKRKVLLTQVYDTLIRGVVIEHAHRDIKGCWKSTLSYGDELRRTMYHYTESGLQNVWLKSGFMVRKTPYGKGISIQDVAGLHKAICKSIAQKPSLTGAELRFLRKEMQLSQSALATLLGTSEQNVSLWERRGRIPKASDRLVKLICLDYLKEEVRILELITRLNDRDVKAQERLRFEHDKAWKEAA